MHFKLAEEIADAVLYEGSLIHPIHAPMTQGGMRWHLGVVAPREYSEREDSHPWRMQTECLVEPEETSLLDIRVRFLQPQERLLLEFPGARAGAVDEPDIRPAQEGVNWNEGVEGRLDGSGILLASLIGCELIYPFEITAARDEKDLLSPSGEVQGKIVIRRSAIVGEMRLSAVRLERLVRIRLSVENHSPCSRSEQVMLRQALYQSLIGTHAILVIRNGAFLSLTHPPALAAEAASTCRNLSSWPVLVGREGARNVMLSVPVILYDYPKVATESTEDPSSIGGNVDLMALRIRVRSRMAAEDTRGPDEPVRSIIGRTESEGALQTLHGRVRLLRPSPIAVERGLRNRAFDAIEDPVGGKA